MKIIVAPDKFKGSLDTFEICEAVREGIEKEWSDCEVITFPMADGGDGFARVMKHYLRTTSVSCNTVDPIGRPINAIYEWDEKSSTAIIEMAVCSGMHLLKEHERYPMLTSTFGTGLQVKDAIARGASTIILGLGGSATNDAGTGILNALGFEFLNENNETLEACGRMLGEIKKIKTPLHLQKIKFQVACDVTNVLYGPNGAAYVYAPQKGASPEQVTELDKGLENFARVLLQQTGRDVSQVPGTGAAGGIAAGLILFFDVELKSGIEMIVNASGLPGAVTGAQLIITGEGRIDAQSSTGKVVGHLASLAASHQIPCHAICGELKLTEAELKKIGIQKAVALTGGSVTKEQALLHTRKILKEKTSDLLNSL